MSQVRIKPQCSLKYNTVNKLGPISEIETKDLGLAFFNFWAIF